MNNSAIENNIPFRILGPLRKINDKLMIHYEFCQHILCQYMFILVLILGSKIFYFLFYKERYLFNPSISHMKKGRFLSLNCPNIYQIKCANSRQFTSCRLAIAFRSFLIYPFSPLILSCNMYFLKIRYVFCICINKNHSNIHSVLRFQLLVSVLRPPSFFLTSTIINPFKSLLNRGHLMSFSFLSCICQYILPFVIALSPNNIKKRILS